MVGLCVCSRLVTGVADLATVLVMLTSFHRRTLSPAASPGQPSGSARASRRQAAAALSPSLLCLLCLRCPFRSWDFLELPGQYETTHLLDEPLVWSERKREQSGASQRSGVPLPEGRAEPHSPPPRSVARGPWSSRGREGPLSSTLSTENTEQLWPELPSTGLSAPQVSHGGEPFLRPHLSASLPGTPSQHHRPLPTPESYLFS